MTIQANISRAINYKCLTVKGDLGLFHDGTTYVPLNATLLWNRTNWKPYIKVQTTVFKRPNIAWIQLDENCDLGFRNSIAKRYMFGGGVNSNADLYLELGYNDLKNFNVEVNISQSKGVRFIFENDLLKLNKIFEQPKKQSCLNIKPLAKENDTSEIPTKTAQTKSRLTFGSINS